MIEFSIDILNFKIKVSLDGKALFFVLPDDYFSFRKCTCETRSYGIQQLCTVVTYIYIYIYIQGLKMNFSKAVQNQI